MYVKFESEMETSSVVARANVGCDEAYTTFTNASIAGTTTTDGPPLLPPPSLLLPLPPPLPRPLLTQAASPQLTSYCSWRRIDPQLQSQGLLVSYNKKNAKGPSNELVAEYLATVVEMQRLTYCHR
ncbi:uncharacterized protein LOC129270024 [Lytechinus pictus]|uniref:uncharacterized protein LOC129270024 n=1 Tax=Lytechinus pictus TaxID=7653 RepID=UPI0030B9C4B6